MTDIVRDVPGILSGLTMMMGRRPDTDHDDSDAHFAALGSFNGAAMYVGGFQGRSPWERHRQGEEMVQVVDGETQLTLLMDEGERTVTMRKGQFCIVPRGVWHRFDAPKGVTIMTATPQPTDHTAAEDPRSHG